MRKIGVHPSRECMREIGVHPSRECMREIGVHPSRECMRENNCYGYLHNHCPFLLFVLISFINIFFHSYITIIINIKVYCNNHFLQRMFGFILHIEVCNDQQHDLQFCKFNLLYIIHLYILYLSVYLYI